MILITGAAKGLGASIARQLAKRGHNLVLHYFRSLKEVQEVQKSCQGYGVEVEIIQGDFSSQRTLEDFFSRYRQAFPNTHGLVNNVGNYLRMPLSATSSDAWLELFHSNVHAPFFLTKQLGDSLKKNRGKVVNIGTSGLHGMKAAVDAPAYRLTKVSLYYMTLLFAKEWACEHVTVNMVSPGHLENSVDLDDPTKLPMGRAARSLEVAEMVGYLFEEGASYITGQNIEVAGGFGL